MAREECAEEIEAGKRDVNGLEMMLSTEVELLHRPRTHGSGKNSPAYRILQEVISPKRRKLKSNSLQKSNAKRMAVCIRGITRAAAAQAVIEQMRGAIGAWERADGNEELQKRKRN